MKTKILQNVEIIIWLKRSKLKQDQIEVFVIRVVPDIRFTAMNIRQQHLVMCNKDEKQDLYNVDILISRKHAR